MKFNLSPVSLLKSEIKLKVIKFILDHDALMTEREIAAVLKVSHMSVNRTLRELGQMNLVQYVTAGKAHLWKVNRKSHLYKTLQQLVGSLALIPDPRGELQRMIVKYLPKGLVVKAVLFGSVAKNTEQFNSDIDLFILVKNTEAQKKIESSIEKLSNECFDAFGNRLSPYILTKQQYRQKQGLGIIAQIKKGIPVYPVERSHEPKISNP